MIVFYGTKGKVIAGPQKQGVACGSCGNTTQNTFGVLRYFHIFWIPLFPIKREVGTECPQCKQTLVGKEVSDTVRNSVKEAVFTAGKVLPMFTGLVILAIIFGYAGYLGTQQSKKEAAYLASPAVVAASALLGYMGSPAELGISWDPERFEVCNLLLQVLRRSGDRLLALGECCLACRELSAPTTHRLVDLVPRRPADRVE